MLISTIDPVDLHIATLELPAVVHKDQSLEFLQMIRAHTREIQKTTHLVAGWAHMKQLQLHTLIDNNQDVSEGAEAFLREVDKFKARSVPILKANRETVRKTARSKTAEFGANKSIIHRDADKYVRTVDDAISTLDNVLSSVNGIISRSNDCRGQSLILRAAKIYELAAARIIGSDIKTRFLNYGDGFESIPAIEIPVDEGTLNDRSRRNEMRDRILDSVEETDDTLLGLIGITFIVSPDFCGAA